MGYDRKIGGWPDPEYRTPEERASQVVRPADEKGGTTSASTKRDEQRTVPSATPRSLEKVVKPWIGTPYLYGGNTKKGTDCSGFVGKVMLEWAGIALPRSASEMYKLGKRIGAKEIKAGDAVFFGQWNRIDHVGIALDNTRFIHASTSKGVMISPLNDPYWSKRYKGARRF